LTLGNLCGTFPGDEQWPAEPSDQPGLGKFCYALAKNKPNWSGCTLCACRWIRTYLCELFDVGELRSAVTAAEKFASGQITRKELMESRKKARKVYDGLAKCHWDGTQSSAAQIGQSQASQVAWLVTFAPFSSEVAETVGKMIANALVWHAKATHPKRNWWDLFDDVHDSALATMAEDLVALLDPNTRAVFKDAYERHPDDVSDRRFKRRGLVFFGLFRGLRAEFLLGKHSEETRAEGLRTLAAYAQCERIPNIHTNDLEPIVAAAHSSNRFVSTTGIEMLMVIGAEFISARDALRALLSASPGVRLNAIAQFQSVRIAFPRKFVREFLLAAMDSRRAKDRLCGYQGCQTYMRRDLLPRLRDALITERTADLKQNLACIATISKEGFCVCDIPGAEPTLYVETPYGVQTRAISRDDLDSPRLASIARTIRAEIERRARAQSETP
jgi:hypothetical protein